MKNDIFASEEMSGSYWGRATSVIDFRWVGRIHHLKHMHMKRRLFLLVLAWSGALALAAQKGIVKGSVTDDGEPLIGATVHVEGTDQGTVTDIDGTFRLELEPGEYVLKASYVGYISKSKRVTVEAGQEVTVDFDLDEGLSLSEVVIIGSRNPARTKAESPVPVDVIPVGELTIAAPQTELNQMLHYTTPAFNSNTQTISDGTDHIDPASLRGLGPDQVLVLINGKRRHTTSLVNINGTFGRGNVGTDLNAIPSTAVSSIEVLRDGAAAQYGSDAIAGIINVRLRKDVNRLHLNYTMGANFTDPEKIGPFMGQDRRYDGEVVKLGLNYGLPIGSKGGYINFTGEFLHRGWTNRMREFKGSIFNRFNAVERIAKEDGFANLDNLTMEDVQRYAQEVEYFSSELKQQIANAATLDELRALLKEDATEDELRARGLDRTDFNMRVGQSALRQGQFFVNMGVPVGENLEVYAFGGAGYRRGNSGCFYRLPNQSRTVTSIWFNGTVPQINSNITDRSIAFGLRGTVASWNIDISNTYGSNVFEFQMSHAHNATLESKSPTDFNNGGHGFAQNTANFDISRYFEGWFGLKGVNTAFGAEYRLENYWIFPGTELSWGNYDIYGELVTARTPDEELQYDFLGRQRPAACQCFPGFLPDNEVNAFRNSVAGYADFEIDVNDALLIGVAGRFENYSDFGSTFNYKVAGRYLVGDFLNLRAAYSTGFRAPSLHQIHFSRTSTIFVTVGGKTVATERGTFANTSRAAKLLGIPKLKEETSQNLSAGFALTMKDLGVTLTVDAYQIDIQNRIVLTGAFKPSDAKTEEARKELEAIFEQAQANRATFFANAIDTRSRGLDIVLTHKYMFSKDMRLNTDFAATFSQTRRVGDIHASDLLREAGLVDKYFDQTSRIYLEAAIPRTKLTLGNTFTYGKYSVYLRNTLFGSTVEATNEPLFDENLKPLPDDQRDEKYKGVDPVYDPRIITDLSVGVQVNDALSVKVGANNLFDIYPEEVHPIFQSSGRFIYSRRSPQFSYNGRHLFMRIVYNLGI